MATLCFLIMYRLSIFFLVFLFACSAEQNIEPVKLVGQAQGTYYAISYYDDQNRDFQYEIDSLLKDFDQSVSLWVPNSVISKVNNNDTSVLLDSYFLEIFKLSKSISEDTDGSFDFTVGPLVNAWGFGFDESRNVDSLIIDSLLQFVGHQKMNIDSGWLYKADERTAIDFNAIAQGYSVDLVGFFLEAQNIENYLVDIGGEVKARGNKPDDSEWKVGIEKPAENANEGRDLKAVIELKDKCVATSGNYRKFYEENGIRYSHTINPKTGYPVQHSLLSVSVIADHASVADAYATAFMVMGLEECKTYLSQNKNLDAFLIYADLEGNYQIYSTEGFQALITRRFE